MAQLDRVRSGPQKTKPGVRMLDLAVRPAEDGAAPSRSAPPSNDGGGANVDD